MKKVPKKLKMRIYLSFLLPLVAIVAISCARDGLNEPLKDISAETEITVAKQWFEERAYSENYMLAESGKQLYKDWMPDWNNASVSSTSEKVTVEVPIQFMGSRTRLTSQEAYAEIGTNKDDEYSLSVVKLVIETSLLTNEKRDYIMRTVLFSEHVGQIEEKDLKSSFEVNENFNGAILYYDPAWNFTDGVKYSKGKIVAKTANIATRAMECLHAYLMVYSINYYSDGSEEWFYDYFDIPINCWEVPDDPAPEPYKPNETDMNVPNYGKHHSVAYSPQSGDVFFRSNLNMPLSHFQGGGYYRHGYVGSVMGLANKMLCNGVVSTQSYSDEYQRKYGNIPSSQLLTGKTVDFIKYCFNNEKASIKEGKYTNYPIVVDYRSSNGEIYMVLIIGRRGTNDYIFADPKRSDFFVDNVAYFLLDNQIALTSGKSFSFGHYDSPPIYTNPQPNNDDDKDRNASLAMEF